MQPLEGVPFTPSPSSAANPVASTPAQHPDTTLPARMSAGAGVVALRCALQAQLRGEWPDGALRRALRLMCDEAHRSGLRAEQLIVIVKDAWRSLPEVSRLPAGGTRERLLSRVVTMCIEEFYESHEPPA